MKTKTYLCTTSIQRRLKPVAKHLERGDPCEASASLARILKQPMYPFNRQKLRKIKEEVDIGSPDKAEILISIFGL